MQWSATLKPLSQGRDLTRDQTYQAMTEIMAGRATPAQIAAFIVAIRIKGETTEELTGLVEAMREASVRVTVDRPVLDIVGTGGDGFGTFNISTTAAFIAAGAGCTVAKHGNRSASSKCGSADVLEALGVVIDLDPAGTVQLVQEYGFGFFYARTYHPAMRHAGPVRSELGIPTVFNFLGPLTNPATAEYLALGVADASMAERMIGVLANLGATRAFVFHGDDGLDELSTTGPSTIYELSDGTIERFTFDPADHGLAQAKLDDLVGGDVAENVGILRRVLAGEPGPQRDIAVLNAAAGIAAAGRAASIAEAIPTAEASIDSGAAGQVLEKVIRVSQDLDR